MPNLSRRDFLKMARSGFLYLSGALSLGGLLRFLDFEPEPAPRTSFNLGPAADYPTDTRTLLPEIPALLIHAEQGYRAVSTLCTHLGCTVQSSAAGFSCPCHGSRFDADGKVTYGPANKHLNSLRAEVMNDGSLQVYTDR